MRSARHLLRVSRIRNSRDRISDSKGHYLFESSVIQLLKFGTITVPNFRTITLAILLTASGVVLVSSAANAARCLFVSSYHKGYPWADGIERGVRAVLKGKCEFRQFDMDTKRNQSEEYKQQAALEAKAVIETWKPDVVIASDDNAAKYLIQPHYRDHGVPFVFCGINWTVEEYGFPYSNVTGMIEVAPVRPMLERALRIVPKAQRVLFIAADTLSGRKNLARYQLVVGELGLSLDHAMVATNKDWLEAYARGQGYDFIVIGSKAGINDWDRAETLRAIGALSTRLTVTVQDWMMPYTMLGVVKVAEEQGEWAAKTALRILKGAAPRDIPIVANSRREIWVNIALLEEAQVSVPQQMLQRAKKVAGLAGQHQ